MTDALASALQRDVRVLAGDIGERNLQWPERLRQAADWLDGALQAAGYAVSRETFMVGDQACDNVVAERPGTSRASEIVVVGAHYDSVAGSPGANDNGSGVAALLALARAFASEWPERTVRFVAFANEEPPYFQTDAMGSLISARRSREAGENITAMFSLETIGYYSEAPGSQNFPLPALARTFPTTGNFLAMVGNDDSWALLERAAGSFRRHSDFPLEAAVLPVALPGVGWSDQWAYWQVGYAALMLTDTAPFRYPHYHTAEDTPDRLDYARLAAVTRAVQAMLLELARA